MGTPAQEKQTTQRIRDSIRLINETQVCYAEISGPDDIFYVRVTKEAARRVIRQAMGQLEATDDGLGRAYVGGVI